MILEQAGNAKPKNKETMKIICNSEPKEVEPGTTLTEFILSLELNPDTVVAECDTVIINRDQYEKHILAENCRLELIRFVGGG